MAFDAGYQLIPYEPLVARAMVDCAAAEAVQFFRTLATEDVTTTPYWDDPVWLELSPIARRVVSERPGILDRGFSTRAWDAAYWMLAPNRRGLEARDPSGLAEIAVFGAELFPCGATAGQGIPLRLVRPETASAVATHVSTVLGNAPDLYDAEAMAAAGVYKEPWDRDLVFDLLARYAQLYRYAADLGECAVVVLD